NSKTKYFTGNPATYFGIHYQALKVIDPNDPTTIIKPPPLDPTSWTQVKLFYDPKAITPGSANGVPCVIQPGMLLEVGGAIATVQIVGTDPGPPAKSWFMGSFSGSAGGTIICRGNPGPRQAYNPRRDSSVVLYMTMIQ